MRPFVLINVAVSADGKMDTRERQGSSISSSTDMQRVLRLRAGADAVMVGGHTLVDEDPKLTVKNEELRQQRLDIGLPANPLKVGITSQNLPAAEGSFMTAGPARRVIFTTNRADPKQIEALTARGAEFFIHQAERVNLPLALETLYNLGVRRLMVEGGGTLNFELLRQRLVDELHVYIAPKIFGGSMAPTLADGEGLSENGALKLELLEVTRLDDEGGLLIRYRCPGS